MNFRLVNYHANQFMERYISTTIKEIKLHGFVDWMVARGKRKPYELFFFIEYHTSRSFSGQNLNKKPPKTNLFNPVAEHFYKDIPIYGAYVLGRFGFFVVLHQKKYYILNSFDATKIEDLFFL